MIAAAVMAGVFVPGQPAWAVPDTETSTEATEPELDRGPDGLQAPDAASALTTARLEGEKVEVLGERTEMSSTWALPDGTLTTGQAAAPVWVRMGDGDGTAAADWAPVDLTLALTPEGDISPVSYPVELSLDAGGGAPESGSLVTLSNDTGESMSIAWTGELPAARLDGPRAVYEDVQPGVDMVVEATRTGYEQFFVLTEAPADPAALDLSLEVRTEGLEVTADEDGGVQFTDAEGEVLGHSGTPLVWDAEVDAQRLHPITEPFVPQETGDDVLSSGMPTVPDYAPAADLPAGEVGTTDPAPAGADLGTIEGAPDAPEAAGDAPEVAADAGQATSEDAAEAGASTSLPLTDAAVVVGPGDVDLQLTPDPEFLGSPETTYPLVVDPDANFAWGFDTFVQSGINSDQSGQPELKLGTYNGGGVVARSFLNFDLTDIRYKTILEASLYLYEFHSYSCQPANWQVWNTAPATTAARWNNQPGWAHVQATSSQTTGWGSGCEDGYVSANLTGLVQAWSSGGYTQVGLGLRAENESDSNGWKRFNSADAGSYVPALYVRWNTPPAPPSGVSILPMNFDGGAYATQTLNPYLSATVNDVDGQANLQFLIYKTSGELAWISPWLYNIPNGTVAQQQVHNGALVEGQAYFVRAQTHDGIQYNTMYTDTGPFTVDLTNPGAPTVSSTDFPADGRWYGTANQVGTFTLTLPGPDATVTGYKWGLDAVPTTKFSGAPSSSNSYTLQVTPTTNGVHTLQVQTVDRSGRESAIVRYTFNVGQAGIVSPLDGAQVVRKLRLLATGKDDYTHIQFVWRRGPDSTVINPVPLGALTFSDGSPVTSTWTPRSSVGEYLTWDASLTLGDAPGPIQVAARVAPNGSPTAAQEYLTGFVTVTVTPDASYAATDSVGPGSVNLLTGEYTLSATDVDEFGLALGRTTSSRNTQSGFEPQPEVLTEAMQTMVNVAGYTGSAAGVATSTTQFHTGTTSMRVVTGDSGSVDTYATPTTPLNLRPGARYRVSAWVYVPTGSQLSPTVWAQRLNVYYLRADGIYQHEYPVAGPAMTGAWQYQSIDFDIPSNALSAGQLRLYNGSSTQGAEVFFDDVSVREIWAPLGPQWSLGTADGATGSAYTHITQPYSDVASLHLSGGGEIWFTSAGGRWFPEPGAESLTLAQPAAGRWTLTDIDGSVTTFAVGATSTLASDQRLGSGMTLTSANGRYRATMTTAGALTVNDVDPATGATSAQRGIWNYGTAGTVLHMQPDGNLVALSPAGTWLWQTGTGNSPGARLVMRDDGSLSITRVDGTFAWVATAPAAGAVAPGEDTVARLVSSSPPAAAGQTRLVYESFNGRLRLTRLIAPIQPGVDNWPVNTAACATPVPAAGCQVQELVYATTGTYPAATASSFGAYADRLMEVKLWSSVPGENATTAVSVVRYAYGTDGRLREVWDPRISPALKTAYTYDTDGRVLTVTGAGELPWRFTYGQGGSRSTIGNGDLIDRSSGRLLSVTRASLQAGSNTATGPDNTSTIVYAVPLSRAAGGPYDLNAAALATWAQTRGPTDGTAIFGPEDVPSVTTATSSTPGPNGYKPAVVHYLDASGREVNTATPGGPNAPAAGFIDTAEYDRFGNVVRSLDATNRLLALGLLPTASADLAALNLSSASTATRATALSATSTYSADGLDLLRTRGPLLRLSVGNNPNDIRLGHRVTTNVYDEGKPDGAAYHLVTTTTDAVLIAGSSPEQLVDPETTVNGYNPIDGALAYGPTSGWVIGSPTVVTGDAGTGGANLVTRVRYDSQGRAVESRKVGSTGTDAGTVRSIFYTAGPNPDREDCGGNPHYAGLPCATYYAGSASGSNTARMSTDLPVRFVAAYNRYGSIAEVRESATGPLAGMTDVAQSRTTTTTYDDADRVTSVAMTTSGAGVTPSALPKTVTTYDQASGDALVISTVDANGTELGRVEKTFDQLGRMTRYVDAAGAWTNTSFDRYGKPITVTDSTGSTTTFVYDRTVEPRGYVTSVTDSVGGTISATYGPDGQLLTQSMPGGVQLRIAYDAASTPISRTYVRTSDNAVVASSAVVENGNGQYVSHTTLASTKTFTYDRLGRLTGVTDLTAGIAKCTSRAYTYGDRAQRLTKATNQSANSTCPTATGSGSTSVSYSYDTADRLVSDSRTGAAGWVYDPLGRIVDAPVDSAPGSRVQNTFWANDLIATQTIPGVARQSWTLDPIKRFNESTSETWMNNAWQQAVTKVNHYDSDSDSPSWIAEDKSLPNEITRFVDGLDGSMAMQTGKTGTRVLQLIDLQGSVMTTLPIADNATTATWTAIRHQTADEYGAPTSLTTGARAASTGAAPGKSDRYGWLGGAQRSAQALAGVMLMGVRLYDPATGRFWSTDPVPGGNSTTYDYCSADPINCTDLNGQWGWFKKLVKKAVKVAAVVGEVASNIPGPIGAAAAGISAVAYAAQGNKSKAIEMGITAAAAMIPGGSAIVKAGARAVRAAGNVAARAGQAVSKAVKGCNSFAPETGVLLGDGSVAEIASVSEGDLVTAVDPTTGVVSIQPVLAVIVGVGTKHLIEVSTVAADNSVALQDEEFADRGSGVDTWTATAQHPLWVVGAGWTDASQLAVGDRMRTASGEVRLVASVADRGYVTDQTVFNLSVANVHTFVVGSPGAGVIVHNRSVCSVFAPNAHRGPGVYSIHFADGSSYVGRSLNVRARVNSHFTKGGKFYADGKGRGEIVGISTRKGTVDIDRLRRAEQARIDRLVYNGRNLRNARNELRGGALRR